MRARPPGSSPSGFWGAKDVAAKLPMATAAGGAVPQVGAATAFRIAVVLIRYEVTNKCRQSHLNQRKQHHQFRRFHQPGPAKPSITCVALGLRNKKWRLKTSASPLMGEHASHPRNGRQRATPLFLVLGNKPLVPWLANSRAGRPLTMKNGISRSAN